MDAVEGSCFFSTEILELINLKLEEVLWSAIESFMYLQRVCAEHCTVTPTLTLDL